MKPNPGGQIDPREIVGRDALIAEMWEVLSGRSIYMNDLRRIGKTQIMVKMHAENPVAWLSVKRDLGGFHTAAEFATQAFRDSASVLSTKKRGLRRMTNLLGELKGTEIAGVLKLPSGTVAPWKEVLSRTFSDIDEEMAALGDEYRMVFFWDEMPFLLDNIAKRENPLVAMEVLDVLRALGQDYDRVRLLLTGSIGLHHILTSFRREGYSNSPLNRMEHVQPGPLAPLDGRALSSQLLSGAGLECENLALCSAALAEAVGNVAFYIHKLCTRLPRRKIITPAIIAETLLREISSDNNDWDLAHYRDRLGRYYGAEEELALAVLDTLANTTELSFQEIQKGVATRIPLNDNERLRGLLGLLCRDHYLVRSPENRYRFYMPLVKHWWTFNRSL